MKHQRVGPNGDAPSVTGAILEDYMAQDDNVSFRHVSELASNVVVKTLKKILAQSIKE